jgi:hypothetical protein
MKEAFDAVIEIKNRTAKESADNVKRAKDRCTREHRAVLSRQIDL